MRLTLLMSARWCLCLSLVLCSFGCTEPAAPSLVGKWNEQTRGTWEFTADGKAIVSSKRDATYTLEGTKMVIDFHDHQKLVITYTIELNERKLILRPEGATGEGALPTDWETPTILVRAD